MNEPLPFKTDFCVYDDLKLTSLISGDVIAVIENPCCAADIIHRQNMFRTLENTAVLDCFKLLADNMARLDNLDSAYSTARTDNEKHIIFAALMDALMTFMKNAVADKNNTCELYERFRMYFTTELEKNHYKKVIADLSGLDESVKLIRANIFKIHGENIKIAKGTPVTFIDRIAECADNLGLNGLNIRMSVNKQLASTITDTIADLYPEEMRQFKEFYEANKNYYIKDILRYKTEIAFYLEFIKVFNDIKSNGIPMCYPTVAESRKINVTDAYDITLLTKNQKSIIPNDIDFDDNEPFFYLTGANGGGKTTYLRTVGITVMMFLNGCPTACRKAEIYPMYKVFTHFPRDERFENTGRFDEEQARVDGIIAQTDSDSLVLLNETYSTATEEDAVALTGKLADTIYKGDAYGIYITHQHGISETEIPYLNVVVDRNDENRRTYKVAKRRNEHGSYAADVLKKYSLTRETLSERFGGIN
jgi:Mismatch repair ATPase (MutS family)